MEKDYLILKRASASRAFLARRIQLILLAASNKIPTVYGVRNSANGGANDDAMA
jgi:hypothetical protein